jgi:cell division septation protein DedD
MGKDTVRWLTYAAILVCLGSLMYIISQKNKGKRPAPTENTTEGVAGTLNTFPNSAAGAPIDTSLSVGNANGNLSTSGNVNTPSAAGGNNLAGNQPTNVPSEYNTKVPPPSVLDVTPEVSSSARGLTDAGTNKSSVNKPKTAKEQAADLASKGKITVKKPEVAPKSDVEKGGEFLVIAGVFAVADHATAQVQKLQKLGFKNAAITKFDKLSSTVVAGSYSLRTAADEAVRKLAKDKVESFVRPRTPAKK